MKRKSLFRLGADDAPEIEGKVLIRANDISLHNFLQIIVAKTTHGSDVEGEHVSEEDVALPHVYPLPKVIPLVSC